MQIDHIEKSRSSCDLIGWKRQSSIFDKCVFVKENANFISEDKKIAIVGMYQFGKIFLKVSEITDLSFHKDCMS